MAQRSWRVFPDLQVEEAGETIELVSREALAGAVLDAVAVVDRMGGSFSVHVGRRKTGFPGEAVTTDAVVLWSSGPRAKPEPEADHRVLTPEPEPQPEPLTNAEEEALIASLPDPEADPDAEALARLDEEDLSAIPAGSR